MTAIIEILPGRTYMGKISYGSDFLEEVNAFCLSKNIRLGRIDAIGAVKRATIGFYDHESREYKFLEYEKPLEILSLIGNISIKDNKPMVHAHVTLSDENGMAFGGHLAPGTLIFACEFTVQEFIGESLNRGFDEATGLPLWDI
ncbi:MAG: DNA-binding protein [Proteobacteria bacterium]|nr:DNA-binding protein [Pseudomonadota bacterium]